MRTADISGTVRESLADHALDRLVRTILIVNATRNPVAVAKTKLRQTAVQMLLGTVLLDAFHAGA